MEIFYLKDLIHAINGEFIVGDPNLPIKGISVDSRTIKKGEIYFALQGSLYDGHDFIKEAIKNGAAAVVYSKVKIDFIESFTKFPSIVKTDDTLIALGELAKAYRGKFKNTKIVGITGSNGKTSTKEILVSIFNKKGKTLSNKGNSNNRIGLPLSVFNLTSDIEYAVFEMGTSLHGEIKILSDILKPDAGIITNIGFSHLENFISTKGVFKEKKVLLDNIKKNGLIVINNDDEFLKTVYSVSNRIIITFALDQSADVYAKNIILYSDKTNFELFYKKNSVKVEMPAKGKFNVSNALAAASCAIGFGFSLDEIKYGIENFIPPKMRMETLITGASVILINDAYNANPSSIREAIHAVLQTYPGKKINLVFGDMLELGTKSADYHFELGEFINTKNINSIYLLGEKSVHTKEALSSENVFYSKDANTLLKKLEQMPVDDNSVFLFKASRGMKLEEVYTKFYNFICHSENAKLLKEGRL
ncbi:MAG: UDP-N-acetylmuramoyl-tripeptide--D-alanyl-D-alanine ligase [Endomicrobium sp.]|jgi:UDP-N-acetylmuramoyl-tripeptide--D-alanyl-D-alanine ligase|nr:UDP-N-acetylmuramoyl-tripeptide--D-alanyl-D-alanine ligase [Endomicrobium sp.]